jgi:CubicO group peptidase (beta-lactamase class C family)
MKYIVLLFILIFSFPGISQDIDKSAADKISELSSQLLDNYNIPNMVVGVTSPDSTIYLQCFGIGNEDDIYLLGSVSKSFTAAGALRLVDQGVLSLDDKVVDHLPWLRMKNKAYSDEIRVRHLMNHTSGIPRKVGLAEPGTGKDLQEHYLKILVKIDPKEPLDSVYEYCNLNYQLLGLVMEEAAGQSYDQIMTETISDPLGLENTWLTYRDAFMRLIRPHQYLWYNPAKREVPVYDNHIVPSGFIASNAGDLMEYLREAMNGFIDNEGLFRGSISNNFFSIREDIGSPYGMGWARLRKGDNEIYYHDGLNTSYAAWMGFVPEMERGIVILTNINNGEVCGELSGKIIRILRGQNAEPNPRIWFLLRNGLPLVLIIIIVVFMFRIKNWRARGYPVGYTSKPMPNLYLFFGIIFSFFFMFYFPSVTDTPMGQIIRYDPNAGISLVFLSVFILINSLLRYFVAANKQA